MNRLAWRERYGVTQGYLPGDGCVTLFIIDERNVASGAFFSDAHDAAEVICDSLDEAKADCEAALVGWLERHRADFFDWQDVSEKPKDPADFVLHSKGKRVFVARFCDAVKSGAERWLRIPPDRKVSKGTQGTKGDQA